MSETKKLLENMQSNLNEDSNDLFEEIKSKLDDKLTYDFLREVFDTYGVTSGDMYPEQALEWDDLIEKLADLIVKICKQNKED
jgi:flavodoxin